MTVSAVLGVGFAAGAWMIGALATVHSMAPASTQSYSLLSPLAAPLKPQASAALSQAERLIRISKFSRLASGADGKTARLNGAHFAYLAARPETHDAKENVAVALQEAEQARQFASLATKRPDQDMLKSTLTTALSDTVLVAPATQLAWTQTEDDDADDATDGVQVAALETPAESAVKQALASSASSNDEGLPMAGPLPVRRPPANALAVALSPSAERVQPAKPTQVAKPAVAAKDEDEEDEKPTALAFARPENPLKSTARSVPWPDRGTGGTKIAVYDISAGVVHMPNGEKLEAHSGIGEMRDNPKFTHVKMRGPTPPGTYRLSMRESLFHGVAAIRLTPVDGRAPQGRTGLLAHSFLLRTRGDSHGCVAFADYPRFLKAFQRGDVTDMVIVNRHDGRIPAIAAKSDSSSSRAADSASNSEPRRTLVDYLKNDG